MKRAEPKSGFRLVGRHSVRFLHISRALERIPMQDDSFSAPGSPPFRYRYATGTALPISLNKLDDPNLRQY
jgi:hypothetical protein